MRRRTGQATSPEDLRQHLNFIQVAIGRMSSASVVAKGWSLTIAIAAYGYAGTRSSELVALLGMFAVVLFASVDAHYLREERKFILLYEGVRSGSVAPFEMNATLYCKKLPPQDRERLKWSKIIDSWSVRDYYGFTLLVGLVLLVWLHCR